MRVKTVEEIAELAMDRAGEAQAAYRTHLNAANGWRDAKEKIEDPHHRLIYEELETWQRTAASVALASASRFNTIAAKAVAVDGRRRAGSVWSAQNAAYIERVNKVACPQCGAKVGVFCVDPNGKEKRSTSHYARRDAARAEGLVRSGGKRHGRR